MSQLSQVRPTEEAHLLLKCTNFYALPWPVGVPVPFSLWLGTQELTFFPTAYCTQTNTSFLSPFSPQQQALLHSPFPPPPLMRPGLVHLCLGDMSTCSYG